MPGSGAFHLLIMHVLYCAESKHDVFCDVFGMPASTKSAAAYIALKGNALAMPVHTMKVKGTYHCYWGKALDASQFGEGDEAIQKLSDIIQFWVASVVTQSVGWQAIFVHLVTIITSFLTNEPCNILIVHC